MPNKKILEGRFLDRQLTRGKYENKNRTKLYQNNHNTKSIMKYICHQIPDRCFKINGKPMVICSRCLGFYMGLFIGLLIPLLITIIYQISHLTILIIFLISAIPMAIDGYTQYKGLRKSNNALRFSTGLLAGISLGILFNWLLIHILFLD